MTAGNGSAGEDFLTLLRDQVLRTPDAPALGMIGERPLGYAELDARIRLVAKRLQSQGFRPGERMLFTLRPGVDSVVLVFGTIAAGGTIVVVDPNTGNGLPTRQLERVQPGWAATESLPHLLSGPLRGVARRLGLPLPALGDLTSGPAVRHIHAGPRVPGTPPGSIPLRHLVGSGPGWSGAPTGSTFDTLPEDPEAEALILFTADAEAVVHTRGSVGAGLVALAAGGSLMPGSHLHTEQLMMGLPALLEGARWSMPRFPRFGTHVDPIAFARTLGAATHAAFTSDTLAVVLDAIESGRLTAPATLREITLTGVPADTELLRRAHAALPDCEFLIVYGRPEIMPIAITSGTLKLDFEGPGDPLGPLAEGVDARLTDEGELIVSGPHLCHNYFGEPAMKEIATGDLARFQDDELILLGRKG
ncbi:AMP-binding protein [Nocardia sp. NBC_00511]|uniref:AMP-binding protein n=1 Tax=Nocardia sp. NBC_00511 TaxID=2903591 RepID=UPI0030E10FDC